MLYQITNGTVSVGGQTVLSHINFEVKGKEKIAVVGGNGAGKTTLLKLIAGELDLDRDDKRMGPGIISSRKFTVGMLRQTLGGDGDRTVEELLLEGCPQGDIWSGERFSYEKEYDRLFTGFGFEKSAKQRKLSSFSGGEQTKISLIRLLLMKPDLLLLDEPTNHLDIPTVEWLEEYMRRYDKAVIFVSHDRFFLDRVVDVVYELEGGKLKRYPGAYTHYREQKQKEQELARKAYERQQQELKRLEGLVQQFKNKPKKAAFARSRKSIMERMERLEKPRENEIHIFTGDIEPKFPGSKWVLEAEHLKIGYGTALLELSLRVRRGQKIGIIGDNGVGKSTFLKTAAGLLAPLDGTCTLGEHTLLGYFDQFTASVSSDKQVAEHFHDLFPGMTEQEVRRTLGAYLFPGREAAKRVDELSGGEKARLVLAELLCSRPNLLILDEPTNHMDIPAKETLESAFRAYRGTILFVSHDRYFIRQVADAILVFDRQGVRYYPFGYEHYLQHSGKHPGEDPAALVRAEDQAMLADLKAVPKGERHQVREINSEDAYVDWKLRLAAEPLEEAREQVALLWQRAQQLREDAKLAQWSLWIAEWEEEAEAAGRKEEAEAAGRKEVHNGNRRDEEEARYEDIQREYARIQAALEQAWGLWTERCLEWMELWQSLGL